MDQGKGLWSGSLVVPLPRIGPEEWVQTREGEILLDKTDLLMEDAEVSRPSLAMARLSKLMGK